MTRFSELYQNQFRFSVEVFPPKTPKGVESLFDELQKVKRINPAYVSVTYGAMGTTRDLTRDLALRIQNELKLTTAFHFTCVGFGRTEIKNYVQDLFDKGLRHVVALRGDRPSDPGYRPPADGFRYASELVSYLKGIQDFSIAVAGYPEKHVEATDLETDIQHLKYKVLCGADVIITQLFFDNSKFYAFVDRCREMGIRVPIIAGIMPILNLSQIERITGLCGASLPVDLINRLKACEGDENKMRDVGIEHAISQVKDLQKNHVAGVHFYGLNKSHSILGIVDACS